LSRPPVFSVLIVNYNGGSFLQGALDSLKRQTCRDFEVILVDNASSDGSVDGLDIENLPSFTLLREIENHGFARANNLAAQKAQGHWLALLNPDAEAAPNWLAEVSAGIQRHPNVKAYASAQYVLGQPDVIDGAGDAYFGFGIPWRGGYGRPESEMPRADGWCFSGCGASAIYEAELFRDIGGFDERFFCFCEDVDLGFRLQLLGHDCRFLHKAIIHHAGSALSGKQSAFSIFHGTRNRVWTYAKNMPAQLLLSTLPGHVALSVYLLLRSSFTPRFKPMLRGLISGFLGAVEMRFSQRWRPAQRTVSLTQLLNRMSWHPGSLSRRRVQVRTDPD